MSYYQNWTNVEKIKEDSRYSVYPNPTNRKITISGISPMNDINVKIVDHLGKLIYNGKLNYLDNSIEMTTHTAGFYYVVINDGAKQFTQKILVLN